MIKPRKKPMTLEQFARAGGLARAAALTAEQRRQIAVDANKARQAKRAELFKQTPTAR